MKNIFFLVLFILLSLSLQAFEQQQFMVNDDRECQGCGGGGSSTSSSSSSQSNKTKQFYITPKFIQCLKDSTAVPVSIINSISTKTYIYMTNNYEYVTSGYSQMILNKINARFKFCSIVIERLPPATNSDADEYPCLNALGVTECFIQHLDEESGNDLQNAYNARTGNSNEEEDDTWKELIITYLDNDQGYFVVCLQLYHCAYYFGVYLGY